MPSRPRRARSAGLLAAALAVTTFLTACSGDADGTEDSATDGSISQEQSSGSGSELVPAAEGTTSYPLTLDGWLGETTLEERPERIAVLGFSSNLDALEAIDVVPVYYGGRDAEADWVWNDPAYLDAIETTDVPEDDGINFEGVAASEPDLIVAFNAVWEQSDYDKLAAIAPVLDLGEDPGNGDKVDWREVQRELGEALDLAAAADEAVTGAEADIAAVAEEHPEFAGKTFTMAYDYGPEYGISYYTVSGGPAEGVMLDLGFEPNPLAEEIADDAVVSEENQSLLDADVLLMIYSDEAIRTAREKEPLFQDIPAVADGRYEGLAFEPDPPYQLARSDGEMVDNAVWVLRRGASAVALPWAAEEIANGWLGNLEHD